MREPHTRPCRIAPPVCPSALLGGKCALHLMAMSRIPGLNAVRGALGAAVLTWASSFPLIRMALESYSPAQLAFLRYSIVSAVLFAYTRVTRAALPPLRDTIRLALLGVLGMAVYALLLMHGQREVPAGEASLIISSSPVWMVLLAALFAGERPSLAGTLSVAVSFAGTAVIALHGSSTSGGVPQIGTHA